MEKVLFINANMKRYNNLYEKMIAVDNINTAYKNAKIGKRHYREVIEIDRNPGVYIDKLHHILKSEQFINSDYVVFKRFTGHKEREIYKLPFFPDRIVHHCIVQIMQPIWISILIRNTFSTIPYRGIHDGVNRIKHSLKDKQETKYCLKMDVKKYYPSIDHDILKSILRRKIKDKKLINLMNIIIDSAPGIPIGNYISQWFGNIYLAYFDHFVKENLKVKYYFRYADDLVIFDRSKQHLSSIKTAIEQYLNNNLNLKLKENYQIFPIDIRGVDFLGYRFFHDYTLIRKSIVNNFKRKIKNRRANKHIDSAYWGWFKHADTYRLTNKYFTNERILKN